MEELRLSWRALRCELGGGAVFVGIAPRSQLAAVEAHAEQRVPPEPGKRTGLRFLRVPSPVWIPAEPVDGSRPVSGAVPVTMSVVLKGLDADRAMEALADGQAGSDLFAVATGLQPEEERRLAAALAAGAPSDMDELARRAVGFGGQVSPAG